MEKVQVGNLVNVSTGTTFAFHLFKFGIIILPLAIILALLLAIKLTDHKLYI